MDGNVSAIRRRGTPDLAADASTTGTVAVGGSAKGEVERAGDSDWFAVTLKAGKTYTVDLKGRDTGDGTLKDPYLDGIFDTAGRRVDATWDDDSGEGRNSRTTVAVEADGTYYVAAGASGRKKGTYTVTVTENPAVQAAPAVAPDDFATDASTTGTVAVGGSATGEVERAGDSDWFAVTLKAGKTYTVDLKGRDTGDGTLKDPYLDGVFDAAGRPVDATWDEDSGEGRNSRTTVAVEADGTYYVAAGASGRKKGTYTVTVTENPAVQAAPAVAPDDFAADASTTGTVAVGGSATGEVERAGDSDWFAVTLKAGKTYTVDLKGRDTGDGTLKDPYLDGVFDAAGRPVDATWDDDSGEGRNSRTTVAPWRRTARTTWRPALPDARKAPTR